MTTFTLSRRTLLASSIAGAAAIASPGLITRA